MRLDFFFDFACPWCFIGKHRLERAMALRPQLAVEFHWQPFLLSSHRVRAGATAGSTVTSRPRHPVRGRDLLAAVAEAARQEGLPINIHRVDRPPDTLAAHRLVRYAGTRGLPAGAIVGRLFLEHFLHDRDIGDIGQLGAIASDLGLDRAEAMEFLKGRSEEKAILAIDAGARRMGIHAIPCVVIDRRFAAAGAQDPGVYLPLLDIAASHGTPPADGLAVNAPPILP